MKAFKVSLVLFVISLLAVSFKMQAIEVDNLYTGKILVTDKTLKTRVKAHKWAIEQVFVKVTGNRDVLKNKRIQSVVRNRAANYIKSFAFITDEQDRTFLVDEFDQSKINKLLREVGASIWGKRRPQTILWLAVEENLNRNILESNQFPQLAEFLIRSADDRGLPIILPKMDERDKSTVFVSDVWARFDGPVSQASNNYDVQSYVMARMRYTEKAVDGQTRPGWLVQFQLMSDNAALLKGEVFGEQFTALKDMINQITDYFASQYAIKSESLATDQLDILVSNVANVVNLVKAEKLLLALPPVSGVQLLQYGQKQAQFKLQLSGEALDVVKALALQPEFEEVIEIQVEQAEVQLTNEQRLEKLTSDYLRQGQGQRPEQNETPVSLGPITLKYSWQGT